MIYFTIFFGQFLPLKGIHHHIHHLSDPHKGEDGLGGLDAVLYQRDWDHVLDGIVDEVVWTSNLLEMVLGVMEGLIRGGYYLDSIFDPSAVDRNVDAPLLQSLV